jgi:hypothetical protein
VAGTEPAECRLDDVSSVVSSTPLCLCANNGQCRCRANVAGLKCDQCAAGAFSLDPTNLSGCTRCFCFNRTV